MPSVTERVLSLIEASGLSRRAFGERIGLDESKMSKALSGTRRFSSLDLARVAELCQVTVDWLLTGEEPPLAMAARTSTGNASTALGVARRYSTLRADMALLGYPQPWQPLMEATQPGGYAEQGHWLAQQAHQRIAMAGRPMIGHKLAEAIEQVFGIDVAVAELGDGFDGLAASGPSVKLIVLATSHTPARQRFTLAHELGHLLAGDDQEVHLDRDIYDKAQARDPSEMRANAFAAAFLMPEDAMRRAAGTTGLTNEAFAALATDLTVTPSALAYRLLRLRLIDAGACDRLTTLTAAAAARMVGRGDQFARQVTEASRTRPPGLLARDTYAAYESGAATLRPYANLLGTNVDQLRKALEPPAGTHDAP